MTIYEDRAEAGKDGTVRKAHYGEGRQPWDDMLEQGWAAHFAAASILKYLRRTKDTEHSLESARWYYAQLYHYAELDGKVYPRPGSPWEKVLGQLENLLTNEEMIRLRTATSG